VLYAGIVGPGGQLTGLYTAVSRPAELEAWTAIPPPPGGGAALNPGNMGYRKFAIAAHPDQPWLFVGGEVWGVWRYWPSRAGQPGSDVLVVGLQGRGTWGLADASLHL
jgi:hypothetical protein